MLFRTIRHHEKGTLRTDYFKKKHITSVAYNSILGSQAKMLEGTGLSPFIICYQLRQQSADTLTFAEFKDNKRSIEIYV